MNPFFKPIKNAALLVILAASIMMTLIGCDQDRLEGCEGDIIVENEISDLVVHLGDEPFRRDVIYDEPVVFRHTAGNRIVITPTTADGGLTVGVNRERNEEMDHFSILTVSPRRIGETIVEVVAKDDCIDRMRSTEFKVTVLDSDD